MKTASNLLFFFLFMISLGYGQSVSCTNLISYTEANGSYVGNVKPLMSTMIKKATCYSIEGSYVVIADIKSDEYSFSSNEYIFCGVPFTNWRNFSSMCLSDCSYGERFHDYIIGYKCDCY